MSDMTVRPQHHTVAEALEAATLPKSDQAVVAIVARLQAELTERDAELAELRQRDRVISRQLDQRAGGRDAFTQALIADLDAEKDKVKARDAEVARLRGAIEVLWQYYEGTPGLPFSVALAALHEVRTPPPAQEDLP